MKKSYFFLLLTISINYLSYSQIIYQESASLLGAVANYGSGFLGGGISFHDFDNDGWDDLTIATEEGQAIMFFKNNNGTFNQIFPNIPSNTNEHKQVIWIDYDNDGDKDLYLSGYNGPNKLYNNDGNFNFSDVTSLSGLSFSNLYNFGAAWGDYNNDGYLDVFLTFRSSNQQNRLFHNNGDGTFSDISDQAGISNQGFLTFCASFFDYDKDGWQDIYMANDRDTTRNVLYHNNGDGTFTDNSLISGADLLMDAMSTAIGDYNNDGWLDIYITNTNDVYEGGVVGNALLQNNGNSTFTNVAPTTGTDFNSIAWGAVFLDADNDQDVDLYVSGMLDGSVSLPSAFYENTGDNNYSIPSNAGFEADTEESYANAIGDVNNDGYPEIVVLNEQANIFVWKNECAQNNNWIKVKLEGTISNKDGLGSWIEVETIDSIQYRYTTCGEGYLGQNSAYEFFGLGDNTEIESIKVTWLSGTVDLINNVAINQNLSIQEGSSPLSLQENLLSNDLVNLFPNPTSGIVNIRNSSNINKIQIFDITGKEVHAPITKFNVIDISYLKSSIYFFKIISDNKIEILKIIKN